MATKAMRERKPPKGVTYKPAAGAVPQQGGSGTGYSGGSTAAHDAYSLLDGARYAGYWIVGLVLIPGLSIGARQIADRSLVARLFLVLVLVAAAGGFPALAWAESAPRQNVFDRLRIALSLGWLFLACLGTTVLGVRFGWALVLLTVGFLLSLWWTIGGLPAVAGRGQDAHAQQGGDRLAEALGLGQSYVTDVQHDPSGVRSVFTFRLIGVSKEALVAAVPLLRTQFRTPGNGVRVIANPDDDGAPSLVVIREDVLRKLGPWPGLSRPGGSITEPLRVGMREDGTEVEVIRYREGFGAIHKAVSGMTGAGKTFGEICEFLEVASRNNVVAFWSDTIKPLQTLPALAPAIARVAVDKSQTMKLVKGLLALIEYRAKTCTDPVWIPTPESPAVLAVFEELALVIEYMEGNFLKAVATGRSVGVIFTGSLQRLHGSILDTNIRAQLPLRQCYGVDNIDTAAMILPDKVMDNGAQPEVWQNDYPGYQYYTTGTPEQQATPARAWGGPTLPPEVVRKVIGEWAPRMAGGRGANGLDAGSIAALGSGWTDLESGEQYATRNGWTAPTLPVPVWRFGTDDAGTGTAISTAPTAVPVQPSTAGTAPVPPYGTATSTAAPSSAPEPGNDDTDDDGLSAEEREEIAVEIDQVRAELAEALGPIDPLIADAVREAEGSAEEVDGSPLAADMDLWTGDGEPLDYAGRVQAVATALAERWPTVLAPVGRKPEDLLRPLEVHLGQLAEELSDTPGWHTGHRPAIYRLFWAARESGEAEEVEGQRATWTVQPTMPGWLRRSVGALETAEREELEAEEAAE